MPFSETKRRKTAFQEAKTRFYMKKWRAQFTALSRFIHIFGCSKMQIMHIFGRQAICDRHLYRSQIALLSVYQGFTPSIAASNVFA